MSGVTTRSTSAAKAGSAAATAASTATTIGNFLITLSPVTHGWMDRSPRRHTPSVELVLVDQPERFPRANVENFFFRRLDPVPPAAAQRLEQRRGVGQAGGTRLDHLDPRLQIGRLRGEEQQDVGIP